MKKEFSSIELDAIYSMARVMKWDPKDIIDSIQSGDMEFISSIHGNGQLDLVFRSPIGL